MSNKLTKIITHPGKAHRDEFLAVCFLLNEHGRVPVERREPTPEEMADITVAVVDIGGQYDPMIRNYDHHQFHRECNPVCALTLVLESVLGVHQMITIREILPWLRPTELLDSKGPTVYAREYGIHPDRVYELLSPVESYLLRLFGNYTCVPEDVIAVMGDIGRDINDQLRKVNARLELLHEKAQVKHYGPDRMKVVVVPFEEEPTLALELWCKSHHADCAVTVTRDDRGPGLALFRRNDDHRIDFSRVREHSQVTFAHANGFVCKTVEGADWEAILALATVPTETEKYA